MLIADVLCSDDRQSSVVKDVPLIVKEPVTVTKLKNAEFRFDDVRLVP